mmetsp:Transcript_8661/g.12793  ORF Transcript_8661/g.12793 Transcript_8661/m.12793 type:complete len:589 (+) Transcript_8661:38-1804(+)
MIHERLSGSPYAIDQSKGVRLFTPIPRKFLTSPRVSDHPATFGEIPEGMEPKQQSTPPRPASGSQKRVKSPPRNYALVKRNSVQVRRKSTPKVRAPKSARRASSFHLTREDLKFIDSLDETYSKSKTEKTLLSSLKEEDYQNGPSLSSPLTLDISKVEGETPPINSDPKRKHSVHHQQQQRRIKSARHTPSSVQSEKGWGLSSPSNNAKYSPSSPLLSSSTLINDREKLSNLIDHQIDEALKQQLPSTIETIKDIYNNFIQDFQVQSQLALEKVESPKFDKDETVDLLKTPESLDHSLVAQLAKLKTQLSIERHIEYLTTSDRNRSRFARDQQRKLKISNQQKEIDRLKRNVKHLQIKLEKQEVMLETRNNKIEVLSRELEEERSVGPMKQVREENEHLTKKLEAINSDRKLLKRQVALWDSKMEEHVSKIKRKNKQQLAQLVDKTQQIREQRDILHRKLKEINKDSNEDTIGPIYDVNVTIHNASGIKSEFFSKPAAYITIKHGDKCVSTKTVAKTKTPTFNESFTFHVFRGEVLNFAVYHKKNDKQGSFKLPIQHHLHQNDPNAIHTYEFANKGFVKLSCEVKQRD